MLYEDIWSQRERTKYEGFGKPLDMNQMHGGPLEWFECKGLPFHEWDKASTWEHLDEDEVREPCKEIFHIHDEDCGVFG